MERYNDLDAFWEKLEVNSVSENLSRLMCNDSLLSELTFYLRFFIEEEYNNNNEKYRKNVLDIQEVRTIVRDLYGVVNKETYLNYIESLFGEYTACANFVSAYSRWIYDISEANLYKDLKHDEVPSLLDIIQDHPNESFFVRIEWSMYGEGNECASDFHAFSIDIPATEGEHVVYINQSLVREYDSSIRKISIKALKKLLAYLKYFDGKTAISKRAHFFYTEACHHDVPRGRLRDGKKKFKSSLPNFVIKKRRTEGDSTKYIPKLDRFSVYTYDTTQANLNLKRITKSIWEESALEEYSIIYKQRCLWEDVLSIVYRYNKASGSSINIQNISNHIFEQ